MGEFGYNPKILHFFQSFGFFGVAMNQFDDGNAGFVLVHARFLLYVKVPGDGLAWTTTILLGVITASPVDLVRT